MLRRPPLALTFIAMLLVAALGVAFIVTTGTGDQTQRMVVAAVDRGPIVVTVAGVGWVESRANGGRLAMLVADADLERVKPGQPALVSVDAFPNRDLRGVVAALEPVGSGPARAIVALDASEPELESGVTAWVRIVVERRDNALRAPYAALLFQPGGQGLPAASPVSATDRKAFAGQALAELVDHMKRDVGLDAAQASEVDRLARELGDAAALGLGPESDPATRRERMHAMRRTLLKRIAQVIRPEQQARYDEFLSRRAKRAGRDGGHVGRVFVVRDSGEIEPVAVRIGATDGLHTELLGAPVTAGTSVAISETQPPSSQRTLLSRLSGLKP